MGIPIGWIADRANHNDCVIPPETLDAVAKRGLLGRIDTLHLDRGYDTNAVDAMSPRSGIPELVCERHNRRHPEDMSQKPKSVLALGLRWPVERTNSWLSNYGQMRRNTDRRPEHRRAQPRS